MRFLGLLDQLNSLLVSVEFAVSLYSSPVDGAPLPLRVVRVESRDEFLAREHLACAAVLHLVLLRASVRRARAPEGLVLDLCAACAARLFAARVPLASAVLEPAWAHQRLGHIIT